jgi:predicted enzyme related to lactoylglutathione lyase
MYKKQVSDTKPVNYFAVESISDFLAKIEKLGGTTTQPKQEVPEIGWIAASEDPEGNLFALIQPIRV